MEHYIVSTKKIEKIIDDLDCLQEIGSLNTDIKKHFKRLTGFKPVKILAHINGKYECPQNEFHYITKDMSGCDFHILGRGILAEDYFKLPNKIVPLYGKLIFVLREPSFQKCNHIWKTDNITLEDFMDF